MLIIQYGIWSIKLYNVEHVAKPDDFANWTIMFLLAFVFSCMPFSTVILSFIEWYNKEK